MYFVYSVYYTLIASTCFKHYLLIFRRRCINNDWYIESYYVGWLLPGLEFNSNPGSSQPTYFALNIPIAAPLEDEQVVLETCRGY
jgi:hypothetical protein